jgi:hypothetical protein
MVDATSFTVSSSMFAKAADYPDMAEQCTITKAASDKYEDDEFLKVGLSALPDDLAVRLNKTNARGLVVFGNDTDDWLNKPVFLTTREYTMGDGSTKRGWVITPIQAKAQPAPVNAAPDDDIPF